MESAAARTTHSPPAKKKARPEISWERFQEKYLTREDRYKYEWVNGKIEKTDRNMNPYQLLVHRNLLAIFRHFLNLKKVTGELLGEPDLLLQPKVHRRPDMAWLTLQQINNLREPGAIEVPAFVIEVISNRDAMEKVAEKMEDYRKAGVQVVWQIFPNLKQVHVYTGSRLEKMLVCSADDECSAAPALPNFVAPTSDIFKPAE